MKISPNILHIVERMKHTANDMLASAHEVANRYLLAFLAKAPFETVAGPSEHFLMHPNWARQFLCAFEEMELRNLLLASLPPQHSEDGNQAIIHAGTMTPVIIQKLIEWHLLSIGVRQTNWSLPAVPKALRTPALYATSQKWRWDSEELREFMGLLGLDDFPADTDLEDAHKRVAFIHQKSQEVTDLYVANVTNSDSSSHLTQEAKARLEQFIGFLAHNATLAILEPGTIGHLWLALNNPEKECFENRLLEQLASLDKKEISRRVNSSDLGDFSSLAGLLKYAIDLELKHSGSLNPQDDNAPRAIAARS